jgi:peptide/nickel transport system permease protein
MRRVLPALGAVAVALILAALPDVLRVTDGHVVVRLSAFVADIGGYLGGLLTGRAFTYEAGWVDRSFLAEVGRPFLTSMRYAGIAALVAIVLGAVTGMLSVALRREQAKDMVSMIGAVPDFIMILVLQLVVVAIYKSTGIRVARVATIAVDSQAVLLPLLILTLIPAVFVMRSVSTRAYFISTEEYILVARGRGLSRFAIYRRHVLPNVLATLQADLHKVLATLLGNLFIAEYLFNIRGVTRLIFSYGINRYSYQYNLVANGFMAVLVLYALLFVALRLVLQLAEWRSARG